uniref:Mediator of RNA polymerase II transcription subunit 1 n=1 Tax=Cyclopterus lumpus TaxID=8103 RepID=A0A8C3B5B4_CYCLU
FKTSIISKLHLKFAEKTWNETFQLVRRCMVKTTITHEHNLCFHQLQEVVNVSSMNTMRSRLEVIAKQQGMGYHITEATCYLTGDLFYLEVVLLPCGGVEEVKVAPHGGSPVVSGLHCHAHCSPVALRRDKMRLSLDLINNGRIGNLIAGKEDCPLTIQFYTTPTDEALVQAAQVAVGVSDVPRELQMASVLPQPPQLDPQGHPVFLPSSEAPHETFPACFLLKLQPAVPMTSSFVSKLGQITDVAIPDVDLQWAPLPKLLMRRSPSSNGITSLCVQPLPGGVMHRYVLAGAAWEVPAQRATAVDSIPFTHPAHVPGLLALLRHRCAINTLLRSCITSQCDRAGLVCDLHFEVLPESETSFSVTFHRPDTDSLAVLLVNVCDSNQITCTLFGSEIADPSIEEYLSTVMKRYGGGLLQAFIMGRI